MNATRPTLRYDAEGSAGTRVPSRALPGNAVGHLDSDLEPQSPRKLARFAL